MPEPPSKQLQNVLFGQKLCTPRDVRRCSSRVRRLSRDLPTFDSVWLDALVQSRVLTAFQAQVIETDEATDLTIGPCLVLDRLGHSSRAETFLARHRSSREPCVIKQVSISIELAEETLASLNSVVEKYQAIDHPGLVLPQAVSQGENTSPGKKSSGENDPSIRVASLTSLNIVSRYCEALSLSQLILRRGRVPAETVLNIARQLLESLAVLHDRGLVHGDVSLSNALLARNGQVVLVDCGVRPAVHPEFPINAAETPERYDGIAPELIGTGRSLSVASDLYALGCLLWHLLAGRSAFPTGDPLARLAAHQTERIPDIREITPETPDALAEAVLWLTEPNPRHRPSTASSVLASPKATASRRNVGASTKNQAGGVETPSSVEGLNDVRVKPKPAKSLPPPRAPLGPPKASGRCKLSSFAQSFQHPALQTARLSQHRPFLKSVASAAAAVLLAVVALFFFEPNSQNLVLSFIPAFSGEVDEIETDVGEELRPVIRDLPEPDDFGLIELDSTGPWRVTPITWTGPALTIRSTGTEPAKLLIEGKSLEIRASEIILEGIRLEKSDPAAGLAAMALLKSQTLTIRRCQFLSAAHQASELAAPSESETAVKPRYAIGWQALDLTDRLAGQITIEDSVFAGDWSTIWLDETRKPVTVHNSLKVGPGPFFIFEQPSRRGETVSFVMQNVTLRDCGPVVTARLIRNWLWETQVSLMWNDCVISPATRGAGRQPLFTFDGETLPRQWPSMLQIDGAGSFVPPGTSLVGIEHGPRFAMLPAGEVAVRGLSTAEFTFRGESTGANPDESVLEELQANRRTAELPGIQTLDGQLLRMVQTPQPGGEL